MKNVKEPEIFLSSAAEDNTTWTPLSSRQSRRRTSLAWPETNTNGKYLHKYMLEPIVDLNLNN